MAPHRPPRTATPAPPGATPRRPRADPTPLPGPRRRPATLRALGPSAVGAALGVALAPACVPTTEHRPTAVEAAHPPRLPPDGESAAHHREGAGPARPPAPAAPSGGPASAGYWHWDGQRHRWIPGGAEPAASALPFRRAAPE